MKIGIDLGGSHVAVGLIDEKYNLIDEISENLTTDEKQNMEQILVDKILFQINELLEKNIVKQEAIECIGIACPGTISEGEIYKARKFKFKEFPTSNYVTKKNKATNLFKK